MKGLSALAKREATRELYAEYLRRIDAESVLDHYGAEHVSRRGDEIIHSCLIDRVETHHNHGDSNPSASLNIEKKLYSCYSYGGGDLFWLIMKMEGKEDFTDIVSMLGPFLTGLTETAGDFLAELDRYFRSEQAVPAYPVYHERVLRNWALYHPYLRSRGITKEAAARLQLGYDERTARITIPHWVGGRLVGWQRRALNDSRWPQTEVEVDRDGRQLDGGRIPKYKNSSGFPKDTTLYNLDCVLDRGCVDVIVVESPMSVVKAESLGYDNVVATFGSKVGEEQLKALRGFRAVTVYFDSDVAGRYGSLKLIRGLYRHTAVFHVEPEVGRDLADYDTREQADRILNTRDPAVLALIGLERDYAR